MRKHRSILPDSKEPSEVVQSDTSVSANTYERRNPVLNLVMEIAIALGGLVGSNPAPELQVPLNPGIILK